MVSLCSATVILPVLVALFIREWMMVQPRMDWRPKTVHDVVTKVPIKHEPLPTCPQGRVPVLIFGATSMLGKYIVKSFVQDETLCLISYARSSCQLCTISIRGDMRDIRFVSTVIDHFKPETVLTSVKPPLLDVHYKTYIELNLLSMLELMKLAKAKGVRYFIYVSSIAAAGHYHPHVNSTEDHDIPYYTDYEAPYDVSKRVAEDFLLNLQEQGTFNVVSIRTSGIIGGDGDPYDYMRFPLPIIGAFEPPPPPIDSNYAGNIADALKVVYETLKKNPEVGGQFYYYTGEPITETAKVRIVADAAGKTLIILPLWILKPIVEFFHWIRWDPLKYSYVDIVRMGLVEQTFNQTKFHKAFPDFKPQWRLEDALRELYKKV